MWTMRKRPSNRVDSILPFYLRVLDRMNAHSMVSSSQLIDCAMRRVIWSKCLMEYTSVKLNHHPQCHWHQLTGKCCGHKEWSKFKALCRPFIYCTVAWWWKTRWGTGSSSWSLPLLRLRLCIQFVNDPAAGSIINSQLHSSTLSLGLLHHLII